jgi:NAD(P) transhydrogenase
MRETYDLIAIGSGPAGESAAELASFFGHRSAVIEKAWPGGTVTTTGGAPTKTLREAALYFSGFCEGDVYGLRMSTPPEIATDIIRKRTWNVCDLLQKVTAQNIAKNNVDYIQGTARLDLDRSVIVTRDDGQKRTLRAKAILIATGSRPFRPTNISFDITGSLQHGHHIASRPGAERDCHRWRRPGRRRVRDHLSRIGRKGNAPRSRDTLDKHDGWRGVGLHGKPL